MFRSFIFLVCAVFLTGCSGSAYHLPEVNQADVQAMQTKLQNKQTSLKIYERSDQKYKQLLAGITNRLTKNAKPLCAHAGYEKCHFETVYNPGGTVNAYASEGYKITLYRGLLQYLKNTDEIAAVVAHEMGHHLANHNQETQENVATGAVISGVITAVLLAAATDGAYQSSYQHQQNQEILENMMSAGAQIGLLSYSKEQEREADLLATYLLSRAGYNLKRSQNLMLVLSEFAGDRRDSSRAAFLDTHPAGIERFVAWEKAMEEVKSNPSKLPYRKEGGAPQSGHKKEK